MSDHEDVHQLREENERLKIAIEELKVLNDIAVAVSSTMALEDIMSLVVQKCIKHLQAEQGSITVLDPNDKARPFHTMVRKADRSEPSLPYRLDTQLMGWILTNRRPLTINDLKADNRFDLPTEDGHARTL